MAKYKYKYLTEGRPTFSDPKQRDVLLAVLDVMRDDLEYCREMQDACANQDEKLAWQNKIMHNLDLTDEIRDLWHPCFIFEEKK